MAETTAMMARALRLARRGRGRTHPNPRVGAVVVADHAIVGEGYHAAPGEPHAERVALARAGRAAQGATLYVTLEPCRHQGRTPPCTEQILASGVRRVVIAVRDPHPQAGGGGEVLRAHGVEVVWGDGFADALLENAPFFSWQVFGRPWVTLKAALSADGRLGLPDGGPRYLSGPAALTDVHRLRARVDAVLVGAETVRHDNPRLTCRLRRGGRDPVRVAVDGSGRLTGAESFLTTPSAAPALVYTTEVPGVEYERRIFESGGELVRVGNREGHTSLPDVLRDLGERDLLDVMVEAGPTLGAALWADGLVDEWVAYWTPWVAGGAVPPPLWGASAGVGRLRLRDVRRLGDDVRLRAVVTARWEELSHVLRHH
jgi:diaminohydroxyphosphoribosylaminopyrimidine deaminase/5-amino-6-(5-phosphoribosylamino)uracil reductase